METIGAEGRKKHFPFDSIGHAPNSKPAWMSFALSEVYRVLSMYDSYLEKPHRKGLRQLNQMRNEK